MNPFRLIFGMDPPPMRPRADIVTNMSEDGQRRVVFRDDPSQAARAYRFNQEQIYGAANVSPHVGMSPVVEVRGADGNWTPISGSREFIPDVDTQIAMLQSYEQTGRLGVLPPGDDALAGEAGPLVSPITAANNMDVVVAPGQTASNQASSAAQKLEPANAQVAQAVPNMASALGGQLEATPYGGTRLKRLEVGDISVPLTGEKGEEAKRAPTGPTLLPVTVGSDSIRRAEPRAVGDGMSRAMDVLKQQKSWLNGGGVF